MSSKYVKILQQLIVNNIKWRVATILRLLELYKDKNFDFSNPNELQHFELTLSTLNVTAQKEDLECKIDGEYYDSYVSYLKYQLCELLICASENNLEIGEIVNYTQTSSKIVQEYLGSIFLFIVEGCFKKVSCDTFEKKKH